MIKDIKKVNGDDITKQLYIGDLIKPHDNSNQEIHKGKNVDNTNRKRTNYLYSSNIVWNDRSKNENKEEFNRNKPKNETQIIQRKERFHRKVSNDFNNLNEENNFYGEKEIYKRNYDFNSNKGKTQISSRYHLRNRVNNQ